MISKIRAVSRKPNKTSVKHVLPTWSSTGVRTVMIEQVAPIGWLELRFIALEPMFAMATDLELVFATLATSCKMGNVSWKRHVRQMKKTFPIGHRGGVVLSLVEAVCRHVLVSVLVTLVMVTLLRPYVIVDKMTVRFWPNSHVRILVESVPDLLIAIGMIQPPAMQ